MKLINLKLERSKEVKLNLKLKSIKEEVKVEKNAAAIVTTDVEKLMDLAKIYSD
jgi:hypothetical protein